MFAAKTSELFRRLNRAKYTGKRALLYKYEADMRYSLDTQLASSHDGITTNAKPVMSLVDESVPDNVDIIGIDEGQFMDGIADFSLRCVKAGKHVHIAALNGHDDMTPWANVQSLIPIVDDIMVLHAVCYQCKRDASFTKRYSFNNTKGVIDIGGADKYVACCRQCHGDN